MLQLELPGVLPDDNNVFAARMRVVDQEIRTGHIVPGCRYCHRNYDRFLRTGTMGPTHRSWCGAGPHCTCSACFD